MRVLRLHLGPALGDVDLHPFVTVLTGLDAPTRDQLVAAVRAIVQGRDPGVAGLVENQGLLIELAREGAELHPSNLGDVAVDLDAHDAEGEDAATALRARHDQAARAAAIDAALLEEVRGDLDPAVAAELDRLRRELDRRSSGADEDPVERVQAALATWQATPSTVVVAPDWVAELSSRWEEHQRCSAGEAERLSSLVHRVERAELRVGDAIARLAAAEAGAVPVLLDAEAESRLEELATRPVAKGGLLRGAKGRTDEEQAEIEELLARVGQPTYAAYMVYRLAPAARPEAVAAVAGARAALAAAEAELGAAVTARDDDPAHRAQRHRVEELRALAADHLGPVLPEDLGRVLAEHREERPNPERALARAALLEALEVAGAAADPADDATLATTATAWLREAAAARSDEPPLAELVERQRRAERRLERHRRALDRLDRLDARAAASRAEAADLERRLASLAEPGPPSADRLHDLVLARVQQLAGHGIDGGVPLVVQGRFEGLEPDVVASLLDRLEAETARVQLLVVTDHPGAAAWADAAGLERAFRAGTATV